MILTLWQGYAALEMRRGRLWPKREVDEGEHIFKRGIKEVTRLTYFHYTGQEVLASQRTKRIVAEDSICCSVK